MQININNKYIEQNYFIIDDEDFHLVKNKKWRILNNHLDRGYTGNLYVIGSYGKLLHRLILNAEKGQVVDHINGNGLDNRKCNLRFVTYSENMQNVHKVRDNKFGLIGVRENNSWLKRRNKTAKRFYSYIKVDNKRVHLGSFFTPKEASEAYLKAKSKLHIC
jgi:hypothetical protein